MKRKDGIRSRKVRKVTEYLSSLLCRQPCGAKLPGIRPIMKRTGTGQVIVCHVLGKLQAEGLIRIEPCRGIFKAEPAMAGGDEIRLLNWQILDDDDINLFFRLLFRKLAELAEAAGQKITMENVADRQPEELAAQLAASGITRCIVASAPGPEFALCLKKRLKVCMELLPHHTGRITTELRDSPDMTALQLDYLFKLGYRRIGYMHFGGRNVAKYPVHILRLLDYYRLMAARGYQVNLDWVFSIDDDCENIEEGIDQIVNSSPRPEVLIVPSGIFGRLYSYCRKRGIRIGRDMAVFACEDILGPRFPDVTVITNNPESIAETFWEMFQAASRGEAVESRFTNLLIRTGRTVPSKNVRS